jgi:hypothetical protein
VHWASLTCDDGPKEEGDTAGLNVVLELIWLADEQLNPLLLHGVQVAPRDLSHLRFPCRH